MIDIILQNPLWQWLWIIAMFIMFYWLSRKNDSEILKITMVSMCFWIAHFLTMEVYAWAAWSIVWLGRTFLSLKYKYNNKIFISIILLSLILWFITYDDYYSMLPIIWSCISSYWYFFFDKIKLRIFMAITSLFWFSYSIGNWLIWWIINEIIVQVILLISMYKMVHDEWRNISIIDKLIFKFKKPKVDIWRYISIYDYIHMKKNSFFKKIKWILKIS